VGIRSPPELSKTYKEGIFEHADCSNEKYTRHAVVVVGYGTTPEGVKYWKIRNSWGVDFGEKGYFRLERGKNMCNILEQVIQLVPPDPDKLELAAEASKRAVALKPLELLTVSIEQLTSKLNRIKRRHNELGSKLSYEKGFGSTDPKIVAQWDVTYKQEEIELKQTEKDLADAKAKLPQVTAETNARIAAHPVKIDTNKLLDPKLRAAKQKLDQAEAALATLKARPEFVAAEKTIAAARAELDRVLKEQGSVMVNSVLKREEKNANTGGK
jgi:hypothetical protein